jgi:hypothetical protein
MNRNLSYFFRDIYKGVDFLVMALLFALLDVTTLTAQLDGQLLARGVADKLAGLLLNVLGRTSRFVKSFALFARVRLSLSQRVISGLSIVAIHGQLSPEPPVVIFVAAASLDQRSVALFDRFSHGHLFKGDLALFLKVLFTDLFLGRCKLCDIGVMALFHLLVGALQDGVLGYAGDLLLLHDTTHAIVLHFTAAKVNSALDGNIASIVLTALSLLSVV